MGLSADPLYLARAATFLGEFRKDNAPAPYLQGPMCSHCDHIVFQRLGLEIEQWDLGFSTDTRLLIEVQNSSYLWGMCIRGEHTARAWQYSGVGEWA